MVGGNPMTDPSLLRTRFSGVQRLHFDQLNRPIDGLVRWLQEGQIDINPPYQREPVWEVERKRNLIRSLIIGLPIGAIFLNERGYKPDAPHYAVIDGKQRILAVYGFTNEEFSVPAEWFPDGYTNHLGEISASELTDLGHRATVTHWTVATYETQFRWADTIMLEREEMVFNLVNYGGVPQGERDTDA
jgi:hypothetical protein